MFLVHTSFGFSKSSGIAHVLPNLIAPSSLPSRHNAFIRLSLILYFSETSLKFLNNHSYCIPSKQFRSKHYIFHRKSLYNCKFIHTFTLYTSIRILSMRFCALFTPLLPYFHQKFVAKFIFHNYVF